MLCAIILNYNDAKSVVECVTMLSSYKALNKIIVVDNHSTDDSYEIFQRVLDKNVDIIRTERNGGYGYGNNYGIRHAIEKYAADYILVSNPDVNVSEKTICALESVLKEDINVAITAPFMLDKDGNKKRYTAWKVPKTKWSFILSMDVLISTIFRPHLYKDILSSSEKTRCVGCLAGSLIMLNAQHMLRYGMYDEELFLYYEETVLGIMFMNHGFKTVLVTSESYVHNHSVSINKSISKVSDKQRLMNRSRQYILKKYFNASNITLFLSSMVNQLSTFEMTILEKLRI